MKIHFNLQYFIQKIMADYTSNPQLAPYLDPLKFYNHGDNPALKNFMKIVLQNTKDGNLIDHRTYVIDRGQRYLMARNWDDFLQRDLQAITFTRAFGIFLLNTMFFVATTKIARNLLPIGRFGIRSVTETPMYQNFGPIGVAGALGVFAAGAITEYKTFKFTLHKFYRHVLMGERNWYLEEKKNTSLDGQYDFSDYLLGNAQTFAKSDIFKKAPKIKRDWQPYYEGPYGFNEDTNEKKQQKK